MMTFSELSPGCQAGIAAVMFISCIVSLYCIVTSLLYRQKKRYAVLSAVLLSVGFLVMEMITDTITSRIQHEYAFSTVLLFNRLPAVAVLLLTAAFVAANSVLIFKNLRHSSTHLSVNAIKESVDSLPTGLCFYAENGMPLLTNKRMELLCREITGFALLDASKLWQSLSECKLKSGVTVIHTKPEPAFMLPDCSVWSFKRSKVTGNGAATFFQITATDITNEHNLNESLDAQIEQLRLMNGRLQRYNETVYDVTRDEEILNTKIKIHDKMGRSLLTTRRYIESNDKTINSDELLQLWKQNVTLLRHENDAAQSEDAISELNAAASLVGARFCVEGKLPKKDKRIMRLFTLAALEALNNAVHHAQAKTLTVSSGCDSENYIFVFTNDGNRPDKPVREGGGLTGLRRMVEREGGIMEVNFTPIFALTLTIPNNEVTNYD